MSSLVPGIATAADRLDLATGERVLEFGCGTGVDTMILAERVGADGRVVGIDRSAILVERARERSAGSGRVEFLVADGGTLGFSDESFDACWSKRILVHADRPEQVLAEVARVLRRGGRVVIDEFDYAGLILDAPEPAITAAVMERVRRYFHHAGVGRQLRRLCLAAGFTAIHARPSLWDLGSFDLVDRTLYLADRVGDLIEEGLLPAGQAHAWLSALKAADRAGHFTCCLPGFSVAARRP